MSINLKQFKKIELHRHLDCSMRLSTIVELAKQQGIFLPQNEKELRHRVLITSPMKDLKSVLDKFLIAQAVLANEEALERLAFETCEDAALENIEILELRYAPTFIQKSHEDLSFERIHQSFLRGVERAQKKYGIQVGLIGILRRVEDLKSVASVTDFIIENRDSFVGIDLADDEVGFDCKKFEKEFLRAKKAGLRITVHAGESNYIGAAQAVIDSIEVLGAERIGHGIQIFKDPAAIQCVMRNNITLEVCLTSNWLTNAVTSITQHPIKKLMSEGVKVTLNTDDPGVFGLDLTHEYQVAFKTLGFSLSDFESCYQNAKQASFLF